MSGGSSSESLNALIKEYRKMSQFDSTSSPELEVRFGTKGIKPVTRIDFDNVVKRLKASGFKPTSPEPKSILRIQSEFIDPNTSVSRISNVRADVVGLKNIQQYCKRNTLGLDSSGKPIVEFTRKQRKFDDGDESEALVNPVEFDDFNFRAVLSTEEIMTTETSPIVRDAVENWGSRKKIFRYITRTSFRHPSLPLEVDLSVIKESNRRGRNLIAEYTVSQSGVFDNREKYEIEIEVDTNLYSPYSKTASTNPASLAADIKKTVMIVLSGLQGTKFPIAYSEQNKVRSDYVGLFDKKASQESRINPRLFIGPQPTTLQIANIAPINPDSLIPNIRNKYTVTEKADGERKFLFVGAKGKIYMIDSNLNVQFTGARTQTQELIGSLVDGEYIPRDKKKEFINRYAAFDVYFVGGKDVRNLPFIPSQTEEKTEARLPLLIKLLTDLAPVGLGEKALTPIRITAKKFYAETESQTIFDGCAKILRQEEEGLFEYETDGLIFTPARLGVGLSNKDTEIKNFKHGWSEAFKWKPTKLNTIDFLVSTKKGTKGEEAIGSVFQTGTDASSTDQIPQYKTLILRVGFDERKHGYINPCGAMIDDIVSDSRSEMESYRPMQFIPTDPYDANAGICKILLRKDKSGGAQMFTEDGEVFGDDMIVEFSYDADREEGWRWIPLRVRYDKTADYRSGGKNFGNAYHVANTNWHSLHNPITEEMISTGNGIPDELADDDVYYNRVTGSTQTRGLRDFHNLYVKRKLVLSASRPGNTLIDYAVGKAGDMPKWIAAKLSFVLGIDIAKDNIENRLDGACARYLNTSKKFARMPKALYLHGNGSVNLRNSEGIYSDQGKRTIKAVFGEGSKDPKSIGKGVANQYGKGKEGFDISSIQFAIHYMFRDATTLHGFLRNVSECTKVGGYFIGTAYDGDKVFRMLRDKKLGESSSIREDGNLIWEVTKRYESSTFSPNSSCIGYGIDVYQETINKVFREYLVSYKYLTSLLEHYGFVPLTKEEAKRIGLSGSIGGFQELYGSMERAISRDPSVRNEIGKSLTMTAGEKKISFLNNYFMFRKARNVNAEKIEASYLNANEIETAQKIENEEEAEKIVTEVVAETKPKARRIGRKIKLVQK